MAGRLTAAYSGTVNAVSRGWAIPLVLALLALEVVGCSNGVEPVEWPELGSRGPRTSRSPQTSQSPRTSQDSWDSQRPADSKVSRRQSKPTLEVVPRNNRDVANLSPDDIINVMEQVGFSDEQILRLGPALHEALFTSGAAAVTYGREAEVVYAVSGEHLFIQSRTEGTFMYNITKSRFGAGPPSPGEDR